MNPESEWKEVTCEGPFAEELPAQTLSYFRNRQGETTLERPAEGVCSSTVERDPDSFVKQYRRAERLLELQRSGLVASPSSKAKALPSISSPSEAGQRLLDEQLVELQQQLQLESDLAPLDQQSHRESADDHDNRGAGEIPHLVELEPEPELEPRYPEHGRTAYLRNKKHHLGKSLWVGGIPDAELAGKPDGCETALRNVFSRFGTVEKVTIREKYDDPTSHSPVGKQSWAMVGFDDESHDAVDRALEDEVMLGDATLEVKELVVKERLSDRHLNDEGKLPEKWVEFNSDPSQAAQYSQTLCCLRKATKTGRWSCGAVKKKKSLGGASKAELRAAFEMFDHDGNNAIDEEELASTMRALAKAGRMSAPSDAQLTQMMSEADVDGDGEIDFDEFCTLIANCDLHPTTCTRCEQSQYLLSEDFYFGEPRPEDPEAGRPATCWERMAARDEKMIHFSFAVVATGAPLQTVLVVLGGAFWFGLSDQRGDTQKALFAGAASVVMTSFALTIGCASRPVMRGAFLIYALLEIMLIVLTVKVMTDVQESAQYCELSPGDGRASIPTSDACSQLTIGASTVEDAKAMCVNSETTGFCEWSDKCSIETTEAGCTAVVPSGTCVVSAGDECTVADTSAQFRGSGALDLWAECGPTTGCRYNVFLHGIGWLLCILAGVTVVAIVNILQDSRFPLGLQLNARSQQNMWAQAIQMSLDPSMHGARHDGNLSQRYGAHKVKSPATLEAAILGSTIPDSRAPSDIALAADGSVALRPRTLGV